MSFRPVMSTITTVALLVLLTIAEGTSPQDPGQFRRCQCISMERRPFGRYIGKVDVYPANSDCSNTEIIATLKSGGGRICLDPDAPWVKKVLKKIAAKQTP